MACFKLEHRVPWRDVDLAAVVNYPRFLSYFEMAELEWVRSLGEDYLGLLEEMNIWLPRAAAHCNFRAPAHLSDLLSIEIGLERLGRSSATVAYEIYRLPERELIVDGYVVMASVSRESFKPVPLPEKLKDMLLTLKPEE
ncbi:MAG TPA: thioesterase family protein [Vicinamibacteria bacterium]|jgi:acyl-CoA thioester hydrolase